MLVRDVLKSKGGGAIHVGPSSTVAEAVGRLVEHNIGSLPVIDGGGRLVGIFTERDILRGVAVECAGYLQTEVSRVMTPDPITCAPEDNLTLVMGKMTDHRVGQLPVISGGEVVGLVSIGDVVKMLYQQTETENRHLLEYLYGPG